GREEDAVLHLGDPDLVELVAGGVEDVLEQVVGQWTGWDDALLRERDRGGLYRADPDGQVALAGHLTEKHDRLVRRHLDPDAHDIHFAHAFTLPPGLVGPRWWHRTGRETALVHRPVTPAAQPAVSESAQPRAHQRRVHP